MRNQYRAGVAPPVCSLEMAEADLFGATRQELVSCDRLVMSPGRPGYVVDHIIALACGGADTPANMQWQTIAEGRAKDRRERLGCDR